MCVWTCGGLPAPPGLGLNSHVRSDDPASQAWPAKGILYLAMTRTRHEEAISPRRRREKEKEPRTTNGETRGGTGKGQGGRREARVRHKDEAQEVEDIRAKRASKGEYRRRGFNQRGLSTSIFPLARGFRRRTPGSPAAESPELLPRNRALRATRNNARVGHNSVSLG